MLLGRCQNYIFFSAEIDSCPEPRMKRIIEACKIVEASVWNPSSEFETYIRKQTAILYAKYREHIVGFALFELYVDGDTLVVAGNECMVMKEHQGTGLPSIFTALLISHIQRDNRLRKVRRNYKSITFVSLTVNYKLMQAFRRYSRVADKSSFKPDRQVYEVAEHYLKKEDLQVLTKNSPFFAKEAFPQSVKHPPTIAKPTFVPEDFQPTRGDAFLFVCRISKFRMLGLAARLVLLRYRFQYSKRILPISRISRPHIIYSRGNKK
jgi:hypothetical protein